MEREIKLWVRYFGYKRSTETYSKAVSHAMDDSGAILCGVTRTYVRFTEWQQERGSPTCNNCRSRLHLEPIRVSPRDY